MLGDIPADGVDEVLVALRSPGSWSALAYLAAGAAGITAWAALFGIATTGSPAGCPPGHAVLLLPRQSPGSIGFICQPIVRDWFWMTIQAQPSMAG